MKLIRHEHQHLFEITNRLVALTLNVNVHDLVQCYRGNQATSRARQVSCYLMHTILSMSLVEIAKAYRKDRTTIGHACRLVEDLRDNPKFDQTLVELEETLKIVASLSMALKARD
ncbi:MAG: helix-turn-helix domain-containing protein [Pseudomonadota bacterium]